MKLLLTIECEPKDLERKIKDEMRRCGITLRLKYVGALQLLKGKRLIVYEFKHRKHGCMDNLFAIEEEGSYLNGRKVKWYRIYSPLKVKICPSCKVPLEEWMKYCPHCRTETIWKIC